MTRKLRATSINHAVLFIATVVALISMAALAQRSGIARRVLPAHSQNARLSVPPMEAMPPLFLPAIPYSSGGGNSMSVAAADFNGDGKVDLVVASQDNSDYFGSLGVLLGNGDGTFEPATRYDAGGGQPQSVATADVNNDGKQDALVVNLCADFDCQGIGSVGVLLGNGDGTLQNVAPFNSVGQTAMALGDMNLDGNTDVVVVGMHSGVNIVGVHLGNGDGTFGPGGAYDAAGDGTWAVAVADLNGDSKPDAVAASMSSGNVSVLLGNGDGTLQSAVNYGSGGGPRGIAVADINGDGKPDLLTANGGSIGVLLGNGDGTFQPAVSYSGGDGFSVSATDVNGDRKPDLLATNFILTPPGYRGALDVLLGNGDGTFQPTITYDSGGYFADSLAAVDVDGDIRPDALVVNYNASEYDASGTVDVLLNNTGVTQTTLASSRNPAAPNQLVTYTATVLSQYGGELTGTVTFQEEGVPLGTAELVKHHAALSTRYRGTGSHEITATYPGDTNVSGSTSNPLMEYIKGPTKTVVGTSGSPSFVGAIVTFTATVKSAYGTIPNGELVTFYDGTTPMASAQLAGETAAYATSVLAAKKHVINATYSGDANFKPSTGTVQQIVLKYSTTTILTSSPNPSKYGQSATFTATVTPTGPYACTGTVKFLDGTRGIGTATLNGGVAQLMKSTLALGTHVITAKYLSDSFNEQSTSPIVNQVVQ